VYRIKKLKNGQGPKGFTIIERKKEEEDNRRMEKIP
jgi:hypothetical protein